MLDPIPLRQLLIEAFDEIQGAHANAQLSEFFERFRPLDSAPEDSVFIVNTHGRCTKRWLLLGLIESIRMRANRRALLATTDPDLRNLGHYLLALAVPVASANAGDLRDEDWFNVSSHIRALRDTELKLLVKKREGTRAFIREIRIQMRSSLPGLLIIDEPSACFLKMTLERDATQEGIPKSLVTLASEHQVQIVVLRTARADADPPRTMQPMRRFRLNAISREARRTRRQLAHRRN
jgi:hypothetical protein